VVALHGELDPNGATALREALIEAIDENPSRHVFVDLEGVDFVDSAGLGVLLGGRERRRRARSRRDWADRREGARADGVPRACLEIHPSRAAAVSGAPSMTG